MSRLNSPRRLRFVAPEVRAFNPRVDLDAVDDFDVRSVPTLVLFEDGKRGGSLAGRFVGAERIVSFVEGAERDDEAPAMTARSEPTRPPH